MKFAFSTVFLAAAGMAAVMAQDPSSSSSSAAAPSSTSSSAMSSSTMSSSSSSAAGGSGSSGGSGGSSMPVATCTVLAGDPKVHGFGCPEGATTSTPPYDSASVESYLIAGYTPKGKQGYEVSSVASALVDSVTEYYPTLTVSYSQLVSQYAEAIESMAFPNAAAARVPGSLGTIAAVGAAVVAGGAFLL